jgi:hypothetical protein
MVLVNSDILPWAFLSVVSVVILWVLVRVSVMALVLLISLIVVVLLQCIRVDLYFLFIYIVFD